MYILFENHIQNTNELYIYFCVCLTVVGIPNLRLYEETCVFRVNYGGEGVLSHFTATPPPSSLDWFVPEMVTTF